jgi:enoyl-CoA hydratase/carnithine racemase
MDHNIKTELDSDGVLLASIDMAGRSMNVFSLDMMDSLERLLAHVETHDEVKVVVLTSGKVAFLAGADLDMIRMFTERAVTDTRQQLDMLCGRLGRLFRRLEKSAKPYVAAINGLALGGGLEISLACRGRVIVDDAKAQLGLPEIKLGLLPGAGGTQRLPRLAGTTLGLKMLLEGSSLSPVQALAAGIVDEVVKPEQLIAAARRRALSLIGSPPALWDQPGAKFDSTPYDFSREGVYQQIAFALGLTDHQLSKYPAYMAIMNCVVGGWNKKIDEACDWEMDCFVRLIQNPVAGNMVRTLFLNRQRAAKMPDAMNGARALLPQLQATRAAARAAGCDDAEELLAIALAAARAWAAGRVGDPELTDVAAVQAELHPAYTGGPFTYMRQTEIGHLRARAAAAARRDARVFALPPRIEELCLKPLGEVASAERVAV